MKEKMAKETIKVLNCKVTYEVLFIFMGAFLGLVLWSLVHYSNILPNLELWGFSMIVGGGASFGSVIMYERIKKCQVQYP